MLASVDARDNAVSLYAYHDNGFVKVDSLATGRLPAQVIVAAIEEGPTLPLWARIAIGLDRSFEEARADLRKQAGVRETAVERQQPARPEIRNKAETAPATPQPGEPARPTKTSFHAVIDAAIEEMAAVSDLWWKALPGEPEPVDGDAVTANAPPRLIPPSPRPPWRHPQPSPGGGT